MLLVSSVGQHCFREGGIGLAGTHPGPSPLHPRGREENRESVAVPVGLSLATGKLGDRVGLAADHNEANTALERVTRLFWFPAHTKQLTLQSISHAVPCLKHRGRAVVTKYSAAGNTGSLQRP